MANLVFKNEGGGCESPCIELSELRWRVEQQQERLSLGEARFDRIEGKIDRLIGIIQKMLWIFVGAGLAVVGTTFGWGEVIKFLL